MTDQKDRAEEIAGALLLKERAEFDLAVKRAEAAEAEAKRLKDAIYSHLDQEPYISKLRDALEAAEARAQEADAEVARLRGSIRDILAHATTGYREASDEPGAHYLVTVGSMHRAMALVGTMAPCREVPCQRADEAHARGKAEAHLAGRREMKAEAAKRLGQLSRFWVAGAINLVEACEAIHALPDEPKRCDCGKPWGHLDHCPVNDGPADEPKPTEEKR